MKNFYRIITLLVVCFAVGCTDAIYDGSSTETQTTIDQSSTTALIIKNMTTSFDIIKFSWSGCNYEYSVAPGESATLDVDEGTSYLYFSYYPKYGADPGNKLMECYVSEFIVVTKGEQKIFIFTDNTAIIQKDNNTNRATLASMSYPTNATLALTYDGRNVIRQDTIEVGSTQINNSTTLTFTMTNKGSDKLLFMGNKPITLDNSADKTVFSVSQPSDSMLSEDGINNFAVTFTPKEAKEYSALITIATNENVGAFTFTLKASGEDLAPKIGIKYNDAVVQNEGTIDFGNVAIGSPVTKEITITNTGDQKLSLTGSPVVSFYGESNGFEIVSQPIPSISVGGTTTFNVKFAPTGIGEKSAVLSIPNNDEDVYIYLKATGYKEWPTFTMSNNITDGYNISLTANIIRADQTYSRTFTLRNTSTVDLHIIDLTSDSEYFTISSPMSVVLPDQTANIIVTFAPNGFVGQNETGKMTITTDCMDSEFVFYVKATSRALYTEALLRSAYFSGVESPAFSQTRFEYTVTYDSKYDVINVKNGEFVCSTGATIYINDMNLATLSNPSISLYDGMVMTIKVVSEDELTTNIYTCTYNAKDNFDNCELEHLYISSTSNGTQTDVLGLFNEEHDDYGDYLDYDTNYSQFYIKIVPKYSGEVIEINDTTVTANTVVGPYEEAEITIYSESYEKEQVYYIH